jgi:hypothetical protein
VKSTWAEARVAWPHSSTSTVGVNQRSRQGPAERPAHGRVRMARNMAVSSVSDGGSTRWNQ